MIAKNRTEDFVTCIEACALQSDCRIVDYQEITKKCYQLGHHGEPTVITPGFSSAYVIGAVYGCGECYQPVPPPSRPPPQICPTPAQPTSLTTPDLLCEN